MKLAKRAGWRKLVPEPPEDQPDVIPASPGVDAAGRTTGRSVLRGGAWNVGGQVITQFYAIAASVVAARFLGAAGIGRVTYIAFVQATVGLVLTAGLPQAVMRYISEALGRGDAGEVRALLRFAWRVEGAGAAIGAGSLVTIGLLGAQPRSAWLLAGVGAGAAIMHHVPSTLLIGAQRWRAFTTISVVTGSLAMGAKIAGLAAGGGIPSLFAVDAVGTTVNLLVASWLARRTMSSLSSSATPGPQLIKQVIRFAAVSSLIVFVTFVVWRRTEIFFLERYSSDVQIALYSIPFSVVTALLLVPQALASVVAPAFATLFGAGATERIRSGYGRALRLTAALSLPLTAVAIAVGPTVLKLVYGSQFAGTENVLRLLLATFPVIPLLNISNGLLLGLGRRWPQVIIGSIAAAVNILLDFLLIPHYAAIGAALANSSAQLLGAVPIIMYANRTIGGVEWHALALLRSTVAAAASGGAAFLVLALLPDVPGMLLGIAAAGVSFVLLAFALRILASEDGSWLEHTFGGALGGAVGRVCRHASGRPRPWVAR